MPVMPSPSRALLASFAALVLAPALVALAPQDAADDDAADAPDRPRVVRLVLTGSTPEDPPVENPLGPSRLNFRRTLEKIRKIAADPEVDGISLEVESTPGWAKTLDLLDELRAAKAAGKRIVAYTEMLTQTDAMLATVAEPLVVPPSGMIVLEGLTAEAMYLKEMFAKLDLRFEVLHIGDFKTAYEDFARDAMSDGQRRTIEALLDEFYGQLLGVIADNRGLSVDAVEAFFEQIFVDPRVAAETGLIDAAMYHDEYDAHVDELFGGDVEIVKGYGERTKEDIEKMLESPFAMFTILPQILNPPKQQAPDEPYVAIVYATGTIVSGKSTSDFQGNVATMGSDTIVEALEKTRDDDNCKAVMLRVNSPGGSALASDMIWRAIQDVREAGKPVVSSMGSVAASGGYWISMGCDAIVAQPSTLTGSIGVVSMLPDPSETLKTMGINVETVGRGPHAADLALLENGPSEVLKATLTRWMKLTYDEFIGKVAAGRDMEPDRVRELAQGRVWTGRQAADNGLVDEVGGFQEAFDLTAALGGLGADAPLVEYPDAPNFLEQLEDAMQARVDVRLGDGVGALLEELGFDQVVATARAALAGGTAITADRVQAVLPFQVLVR